MNTIIYTKTDEAPALATYSFLPIIQSFLSPVGVNLEVKDISLAGRILALFPEYLSESQKQEDALKILCEMTQDPSANIIKLPNISASIPQLCEAISELQTKGYKVPDYPEEPKNDEEKSIKDQYSKVLGSAVNPVLREGNSDRRVAKPVKEFAKKNPHSMGEWSKDSKTHVSSMTQGDFYESEKSVTFTKPGSYSIVLLKEDGSKEVLKENVPVLEGEVVDSAVMQTAELKNYFLKEIEDAKSKGVLLSLHLKATMMKVSDPIMFGYAVKAYFKNTLEKYETELKEAGFDARNGLGELYDRLEKLPEDKKNEIEKSLKTEIASGPDLAMVNSDKGITNLHVPSDVIIDASMPASIRSAGKMWNKEGKLQDTKALIPDRCYAGVYQATIDFCKENGAFDVTTMGSVSNIGLMAKKAEEYGSHDKTFWLKEGGTVQVIDQNQNVLMDQRVQKEDIFRMCQTKDEAIKDWVGLCVTRAKATKNTAVFWLDENRSHDNEVIKKVNECLKNYDLTGLEIKIMSPNKATEFTLQRVKEGKDTISVTGNVLRDYLTDLFPILELGTSAKMLSIVPLLKGGGLFETGAGGSAPKHVDQFVEENHLRWDSLGEFLALAVSLEDLALKSKNTAIKVLANCLDKANEDFLIQGKSPSRKVNEIDNRGSHFYLSLYWAKALSEQNEDKNLKLLFAKLYKTLSDNEELINTELLSVQGSPVDLGGYYLPDVEKVSLAMRPSKTFNQSMESLR